MSFPYILDLMYGSERPTADNLGRLSFGKKVNPDNPVNPDDPNVEYTGFLRTNNFRILNSHCYLPSFNSGEPGVYGTNPLENGVRSMFTASEEEDPDSDFYCYASNIITYQKWDISTKEPISNTNYTYFLILKLAISKSLSEEQNETIRAKFQGSSLSLVNGNSLVLTLSDNTQLTFDSLYVDDYTNNEEGYTLDISGLSNDTDPNNEFSFYYVNAINEGVADSLNINNIILNEIDPDDVDYPQVYIKLDKEHFTFDPEFEAYLDDPEENDPNDEYYLDKNKILATIREFLNGHITNQYLYYHYLTEEDLPNEPVNPIQPIGDEGLDLNNVIAYTGFTSTYYKYIASFDTREDLDQYVEDNNIRNRYSISTITNSETGNEEFLLEVEVSEQITPLLYYSPVIDAMYMGTYIDKYDGHVWERNKSLLDSFIGSFTPNDLPPKTYLDDTDCNPYYGIIGITDKVDSEYMYIYWDDELVGKVPMRLIYSNNSLEYPPHGPIPENPQDPTCYTTVPVVKETV